MKWVLVGVVFSLVLLSVSVNGQVARIPEIGSYPQYGDDFLYLVEGGYAELADSDVADIDYTTTSFSVEAVVDSRVAETVARWSSILLKGHRYILWDASLPGWGLGIYKSTSKTVSYSVYAKVGDGTRHIMFNHYLNGVVHLVMRWDHNTRTLELFADGVLVGNGNDTNIVLSNIQNTENLRMGYADGDTERNFLMVRWWRKKLSDSDISSLYNNWANNGNDRVPPGVDTTDLHSEWLMNEECASDGSPGTGYLKDSEDNNHLQLMGNAELKISNGESLILISPDDGATGVDKSVTLKADGGDADISNPTHPLLYFFQVDTVSTFDSPGLKESDWISHYGEYRPFLASDTTYYWRVKVKDVNGQESPYSQIRSFTTEPAGKWYVRPEGGSYGNEDGSSYDNAWDGLQSVFFNETGIEPGDELYVCGLHYHRVTHSGDITQQGNIILRSGGSDSSPYRVTIRGDCPGGDGVFWGAYKIEHAAWADEGGGAYSIDLPGQEYNGNYFQDVGVPDRYSYILLNRTYSVSECQATPGSFYKESSTKLYVHTTDSGDPTGRIWGNRWGYEFYIPNNNKYITFKNLTFYAPYRYEFRGRPNVTNIRWENCTLWHGESTILGFGDGNHYIEILDCDIGYSGTPIYIVSGSNQASSNYVFARNTIHDCGTLPWHRVGDNHALGIQGGSNGLIEDNHIYHCRDGIVFYLYRNMNCMNNIVRRNYIHDIYEYGYMPNGISFGCSNVKLGNTSGNEVYNNIIVNVTRAMYFKWPDEMKVYNNVIVNANWAFNFGGSDSGNAGAKVKLRNNIAYNISEYYMRINGIPAIPENYGIDSDYNIFYPVGGNKFYHAQDMSWSEWQAQNISGHLFDPHTLTLDPLFLNPENYNFHLHPGSPAIDNGTNVGLTKDYDGNPIPQGAGFDIGAFEYLSGFTLFGDLNNDGKVDISDLAIIAIHFGKRNIHPQWNATADVMVSDEIDVFDVVFVASRFT